MFKTEIYEIKKIAAEQAIKTLKLGTSIIKKGGKPENSKLYLYEKGILDGVLQICLSFNIPCDEFIVNF